MIHQERIMQTFSVAKAFRLQFSRAAFSVKHFRLIPRWQSSNIGYEVVVLHV